ncbi:TonB-dependent receptor plug domain-containing protein [candidate division KSB1 bacterium]
MAFAITIIIFLLTATLSVHAQIKIYNVDPITVTATRLDRKYAETRNYTLLDREAIEQIPAQSVAQLLNHALGVSMNSRGAAGVQSDPSLRGAGFDQVLVLLDGVRINDPQTGHHNMNLPISIRDIERIEILRGQSSALYGPDAFGGVINIITRSADRERFSIGFNGGSFGTYGVSGSYSHTQSENFSNTVSVERTRSDGYRPDTDFKNTTLSMKSDFRKNRVHLTLSGGYIDKKFGANDFYIKGFDHYEEINSLTGSLKGVYTITPAFSLTGLIHFKQHDDFFVLSRSNPAIYSADHTTQRTTFETTGRYSSARIGDLTFGVEAVSEAIESNKLNNHDVERVAVFTEFGRTVRRNFLVSTGLRVDNHSEWGTELNPSLSAGYVAGSDLIFKASVGRAFRAPSFIELYSPAESGNAGSASLKPEKAVAFDIGADYRLFQRINANTTYFLRDQSNTIDWVKNSDDDIWRAVNIFDIRSQGYEQNFQIVISESFNIGLDYTYLDQHQEQKVFKSKYVFIHPKHQLTLSPALNVTPNLTFFPVAAYKDRPALNSYWAIDAKVVFTLGKTRFTVEGMNLTDSEYQEIRDVPMPGAAVYAGISFIY